MEIIDELEPTKRGPYAGVVGYVDFSGNLDTAIAIRTMFWRDGRATLAGGRRHRRRLGARRRRPGMPEQGAGVVDCRGGRTPLISRSAMSSALQASVDRDLVVVKGPDATSFLQSLVSQDLDALAVGASAPSLLLSPQGKLLVDFVALRVDENTWWLVCEGGFGEPLAAGLNRFKIRVKADVHEEPVAALAVRGIDVAGAPGVTCIRGRGGVDVIGAPDAVAAFSAALDVPLRDADAYERARIEAGVPRQGVDIDERTIPQEAFLEQDAVSFTKGCFVGQELVCRIDTRGHVNRLLRRLRASGGLVAGAPVTAGDGKTVGEITSSAGDVALAMVRREVEPGAQLDAAGVAAVVEAV